MGDIPDTLFGVSHGPAQGYPHKKTKTSRRVRSLSGSDTPWRGGYWSSMFTSSAQRKTVVLVHGAWVTPGCWDGFKTLYESRGYEVIIPHWPFMNAPLEELRDSPNPNLKTVTIKDLVDHFEREIGALAQPPIIMGHSFGGLIVQMLVDRGLGRCGVAFDAAPPRGVIPSLTAVVSAAPVLLSWNGWNRVLSMSYKSFATTFANTLPDRMMRETYERQIVPAPGRIYF